MRGLDQHVDGFVRDLGVRAAHDAGYSEDALGGVVGDEEVLGVEGAFDVVERRVPLPRPRAANDDRPAHFVEVVGVQRLAEVEHDVVRRVHSQGDRPHSGGRQSVAQPLGALGLRVDPSDDARDEAIASDVAVNRGLVAHLDGESVLRARRDRIGFFCRIEEVLAAFGQSPVGERGARRVVVLPRHAPHRETVAAVGGNVDFQRLPADS